MKQILIISLTDLSSDPRVNRQIRLLASRYRLTAAGTAAPQVNEVEFVQLNWPPRPLHIKALGALALKLGAFEQWYWMDERVRRALRALQSRKFDLIIANDLSTLPLAVRLSNGAKVLHDAHEYSPREYEDNRLWRFFMQRYNHHLCRTYLPRADRMMTVCQGIADEYQRQFGVTPAVLWNTPPYADLSPCPTDPERIRLIHHGAAIPSRKMEVMIEMMGFLDGRFQLDLMLVPGPPGYLDRLRSLAAKYPRIKFVPPVPMRELPQRINCYDVGLFLLPPTNFNYRHALPNKLFEFIQARLAVAIGPSPEMARMVEQYNCGIIADDFSPQNLARKLNELDRQQIVRLKQNSNEAAQALCFEKTGSILSRIVDEMIERT